jgi:hypothetical protein
VPAAIAQIIRAAKSMAWKSLSANPASANSETDPAAASRLDRKTTSLLTKHILQQTPLSL